LSLYKARPALPGEIMEIREKISILSSIAGVNVPSVYITELQLPGSFIVGKDIARTYLVLPRRLSGLLKNDELIAMFAHNIVQVNNNIRKRTVVALTAGIMTMSSSAIRWGAVFTGFGDYNDPAPKLFGLFFMGLAAPPAATMIDLVSKEDYDAKAVDLCENPAALVSAIGKLESNNVVAYPSLGFLCLVDPQKETFFEYLFNSHLPTETRIKKLTGTNL